MDLFVRASNAVAVGMYERLGYSVYRRVLGYYSNGEDALGGFVVWVVGVVEVLGVVWWVYSTLRFDLVGLDPPCARCRGPTFFPPARPA